VFGWLLIIIAFIVLVAAYFKRVRGEQQQPWGKPVITVCAVVVVLVVLGKLLSSGTPGPSLRVGLDEFDRLAQAERRKALLIGQGLARRVPVPSRIFFLGAMPTDMRRDWDVVWPAWKEGLSEGLGSTNWESLGYAGPASALTTEEVSALLQEKLKGLDVLVSFGGLPANPQRLSIYKLESPPKVAVYFPLQPDLEQVRRWLKDGFIQVAVVNENGKYRAYTPDHLPY